jgi:hypothetical protein
MPVDVGVEVGVFVPGAVSVRDGVLVFMGVWMTVGVLEGVLVLVAV